MDYFVFSGRAKSDFAYAHSCRCFKWKFHPDNKHRPSTAYRKIIKDLQ